MSSEAQRIIAEVLDAHQMALSINGPTACECGGWQDSGPGFERVMHNHREHVAAEIDTAFGGLTREPWLARMGLDVLPPKLHHVPTPIVRFVGGWTPEGPV